MTELSSTMALVAAAVGYLFGSIPFGLVLTRAAGLGDIRAIGSGNIGATNVLRTGRKDLALATLLLDGGKGAIAVLVIGALLPFPAGLIAGVAAVVGHNFPVWLKFKGGKGVATTLGTILAAEFWVGVLACVTWLVVAAIFRYSSLAALIALALAPAYALYFHQTEAAAAFTGLAVLGWYRHHANIARLLRGDEPKIGGGTSDSPGKRVISFAGGVVTIFKRAIGGIATFVFSVLGLATMIATLASIFSCIASVIHFQIFAGAGFFLLTVLLGAIAKFFFLLAAESSKS